jgi:hypothetical protein
LLDLSAVNDKINSLRVPIDVLAVLSDISPSTLRGLLNGTRSDTQRMWRVNDQLERLRHFRDICKPLQLDMKNAAFLKDALRWIENREIEIQINHAEGGVAARDRPTE